MMTGSELVCTEIMPIGIVPAQTPQNDKIYFTLFCHQFTSGIHFVELLSSRPLHFLTCRGYCDCLKTKSVGITPTGLCAAEDTSRSAVKPVCPGPHPLPELVQTFLGGLVLFFRSRFVPDD